MTEKVLKFSIFIFFLIFPVFHLTITSESYEYNKMFLLVFAVLFFLILQSLVMVRRKKIVFWGGSFTIPLFFIAGIYTISALFQSPNLAVALTTPMSATSIIAGFILYFLLIQIISEEDRESIFRLIMIGAVLTVLFTISSYIGLTPKSLFTPAGTILTTAIFLAIISFYSAFLLIIKIIRSPDNAVFDIKDLFYAGCFLISLGTLILIIVHLATDQKPILLPLGFGWMTLLEILKNVKTLILGVGPSNFITAFVLAKPVIFNQSNVWNVIFTSSSSFFFNMATETGIVTGVLYFIILLKSLKLFKSPTDHSHFPFISTLIFALILQIILPSSMTILILTMILLAFASKREIVFEADLSRLKLTSYFLVIPPALPLILFIFFGSKVYLAEIYFKKSLDAIVNNQGSTAYTLQQKAINLNPYLDRYRLAISQLSLALANAISAKTDLTDEDKQNIPKLIQQSIDQGRAAVLLYRTNVANWDNLSRLYASLTNYAKSSDQWAITSYQQRLSLDPYSPVARLALGGFYLYLNRWQDAENIFREAIALKPDFANAHYNLGFTLRQEKKYTESYKELQIALALVAPDSTDAKKIMDEIKLVPPQYATTSAENVKEGIKTQTLESQESSPPAILKAIPSLAPAIELK